MIELLVVLAAVALLLSIAAPRYVQYLDQAREVALKQNLWQLRDVMEKFYADHGRYPEALQELVAKRYLRAVPVDPLTQRDDTWQLAKPGNPLDVRAGDVRSGAPGTSREGTPYATW